MHVILPSEYESALQGAMVQISFTLSCHLIGGREGKHATFTANIGEVIVLKKPEALPSYRVENGSPTKRLYAGPSFSPAKQQKHK
jgi:hypothetical protein